VASAIKGVRSVIDALEVKPAPRTDAALQQDIAQALRTDPATDLYPVKVTVSDGVATLTGKVDSWAEKQIVDRVAEGVKGVRDVKNRVGFEVPTTRTDGEIAAEIKDRLHWDARVDDGLIDVSVERGTAHLTGAVGSALEKTRAEGLAWLSGVKAVDASGLEVEWWARDDMRRDKYVFRTDDQLKQAVEAALLYDPRLLSFNPKARVEAGVVTLNGTVDNLAARRAAGADARNTVGVIEVRNHLRVRPAAVTDAKITSSIEQALERDPLMDRFAVGVRTFDGEVQLDGEVASAFERSHAAALAAAVGGVVGVENDLQVRRRPTYCNDLAIKHDIEDELYWSSFVDANDVHVSVKNGVATLTGTVSTWADYSWAARDARLSGAISVDNDLHVRNDKGAFWSPR
jgi:osmotically-inducible protein OsmY